MNRTIRIAVLAACLAASSHAVAQGRDRDRDRDGRDDRRDRGDVSLYERQDFRGYLGSLDDDDDDEVRNFERRGFNDRIGSIVVRRGRWEFCTDAGFRGNCRIYGPGEYRALGAGHNDAYSSARRVTRPGKGGGGKGRHPRITLYDSTEFRGRSLSLEETARNLEPLGFNDRVESVVVERGTWRLCSDANGGGRCRDFGPGRYPVLSSDLRSKLSSALHR
jgi:hypothetical protein